MVNAPCRELAADYMFTDFGADKSSHFPLTEGTDRDTNKKS